MDGRYPAAVIALALLLLSGAAAAQTATFTTPRSPTPSGVAPLAMWFDATATTCTGWSGCSNPFTDLDYSWDFGDSGAGTWSNSGRSKESAIGPVAFHVYETPGTYMVTLTVTDGAATTDTDTETVVVDDPDVTFADAAEYCFANTAGTFQGCTHDTDSDGTCNVQTGNCIVSSDADAAVSTCGRNRCRFARGDTFTASTSVSLSGTGELLVEAFGSGAKPIFAASGSFDLFSSGGGPNDVRVVDIHGQCNGVGQFAGFGTATVRYLALRLDQENCDKGHVYTCGSDWSGGCSEIAIVEQTGIDQAATWGHYGAGKYIADMGNTYTSGSYSHSIRHASWRWIVAQHNHLAGPSIHCMKFHALGTGDSDESKFGVISDNIAEACGGWMLSVSSSDNDEEQQLSHVIVERNLLKNPDSNRGILLSADDSVARSNVIEMSGMNGMSAIVLSKRQVCGTPPLCSGPPVDGTAAYNNTIVCTSCNVNGTGIEVESASTNITIRNNICYSEGANTPDCVSDASGGTVSNNPSTEAGDFSEGNPFAGYVSTDPDYEDFALSGSSDAVDAGFDLNLPIRDGNVLLFEDTWEAGAFCQGCGGPVPGSRHEGVTPQGVTYTLHTPKRDMEDRPLAGLRFCELSVRINAGEPQTYRYRPQDPPSLPLDASCGDEVTVTGTCTGMDGAVSQEFRRSERMPSCVSDTRPKPPQVSLRR